jgi:hypothetical protein
VGCGLYGLPLLAGWLCLEDETRFWVQDEEERPGFLRVRRGVRSPRRTRKKPCRGWWRQTLAVRKASLPNVACRSGSEERCLESAEHQAARFGTFGRPAGGFRRLDERKWRMVRGASSMDYGVGGTTLLV